MDEALVLVGHCAATGQEGDEPHPEEGQRQEYRLVVWLTDFTSSWGESMRVIDTKLARDKQSKHRLPSISRHLLFGFALALFVAGLPGCRQPKLNPSRGQIVTVAGTGAPDYTPDGRPARSAEVSYLTGMAVDVHGRLLFSERYHYRVREIDDRGILKTFAGSGSVRWPDAGNTVEGEFGGDGGPATKALLTDPMGLAADAKGNVFVVDQGNERIRKVDAGGVITTVAGAPKVDRDRTGHFTHGGFSGDNGPAVKAALNHPSDVAVDNSGNLYIADTNNQRIRKVDTRGVITTVAGSGPYDNFDDFITHDKPSVRGGGYYGDGGLATKALLNSPSAVEVDRDGTLYILDSGNGCIRKVDPNGMISTVAGGTLKCSGPDKRYLPDKQVSTKRVPGEAIGDGGPAAKARLWNPSAIAVDFVGNLYICDTGNERVRKVDTRGLISTVAGNGLLHYKEFPDGEALLGDFSGDGGEATVASLNAPCALAVDGAGNLYIGEEREPRIRKVMHVSL